jgi:hypothetical protein
MIINLSNELSIKAHWDLKGLMKAQSANGEYQIRKKMLNRNIVYSVLKLNRQLVLGPVYHQTTEATDLGLQYKRVQHEYSEHQNLTFLRGSHSLRGLYIQVRILLSATLEITCLWI